MSDTFVLEHKPVHVKGPATVACAGASVQVDEGGKITDASAGKAVPVKESAWIVSSGVSNVVVTPGITKPKQRKPQRKPRGIKKTGES